MDRKKIYFLIAIVSLIRPLTTCAQGPKTYQELLQWYSDRGDYLISDIRPKLRATLNPHDRNIESSLSYDIVLSGNSNAVATPSGKTVTTAGFIQIIDSLSTMLTAATLYKKPVCFQSYMGYLSDGVRNNSWLVKHRQQPQPVSMAFAYWQQRQDVCGGLSEPKFRSDSTADTVREGYIYASMVYVLAHELAHHVHGDTQFRMVTPEKRRAQIQAHLDVSREVVPAEQVPKEAAADSFAFASMVKMGEPVLAAMPVLLLFCGVENYSPEIDPEKDDHPAAVRRLHDLFEAANNDPILQNTIKEHHEQAQWKKLMAQAQELSP
jgi:hypothetical protein